MTYVSSLSCSVLMSKFIRPPGSVSRGSVTRRGRRARALLLLLLRRRRRRELLDQLPDLRVRGATRGQLQVPPVGLDGGRVVARLLGGLAEAEPGVRVLRRDACDLVVGRLDAREG